MYFPMQINSVLEVINKHFTFVSIIWAIRRIDYFFYNIPAYDNCLLGLCFLMLKHSLLRIYCRTEKTLAANKNHYNEKNLAISLERFLAPFDNYFNLLNKMSLQLDSQAQ